MLDKTLEYLLGDFLGFKESVNSQVIALHDLVTSSNDLHCNFIL
jgi:hypothetical protein